MTNGIVIDTSIWVNYFNSIQDKNSILVNHLIDEDAIIVLPVILQETLQGIKDDRIFALTKELMLSYNFIKINHIHAALIAAGLYRFLRLKRIKIRRPNDCLIASLCIENKIPLFHTDKDFDQIAKHTSLKIYK